MQASPDQEAVAQLAIMFPDMDRSASPPLSSCEAWSLSARFTKAPLRPRPPGPGPSLELGFLLHFRELLSNIFIVDMTGEFG